MSLETDIAASRAPLMAAADRIISELEALGAKHAAMIDAVIALIPPAGPVDERIAALFDAAWYLRTYPDVAQAGLDPLAHFLAHPGERRDPNPRFDSKAHAAERGLAPDVLALADYLEGGAWRTGAGRAFIARHPAIAIKGVTPLET